MKRKGIENDWVHSTLLSDLNEVPSTVVVPKLEKVSTFFDMKFEFETGVSVSELDTIPAELMDYVFP